MLGEARAESVLWGTETAGSLGVQYDRWRATVAIVNRSKPAKRYAGGRARGVAAKISR